MIVGCSDAPTAPGAVLSMNVTTLTFAAVQGSALATQTFAIQNTGGTDMVWIAAADQGWVTLQPAAGVVPAGQTTQVTVTVSTASLQAGSHAAVVTVTAPSSNGSPRSLVVALTVTSPPTLSVDPAALSFAATAGSAPATQTFTVSNSGGSPLNWAAAGNQTWLTATPASGTLAAGQSATVTVTVSSAALSAGAYTGAVTVTSAQASNSPRTVAVALSVTAPASLAVAPPSLSYAAVVGTSPASQTFTVTNAGGAQLTWAAAGNQPWLAAIPASGTLAPGQSATVTVSASTAALATGNYTGTVTVTSAQASNSPQSVAVALTVGVAPVLTVEFSTLAGTLPVDTEFTGAFKVTNTGGGMMSWTAAENSS